MDSRLRYVIPSWTLRRSCWGVRGAGFMSVDVGK